MLHRPPLLFLDEPTSGVDPVARREFWDLIYQFASEGTTVFITTHYMDEAEHCSRVGFMYRSKLLAFDSPACPEIHLPVGRRLGPGRQPAPGSRRMPERDGRGGPGQPARGPRPRDHRPAALDPESLTKALSEKNITVQSIETVELTLEDVFTLLAHRGKASLVDR